VPVPDDVSLAMTAERRLPSERRRNSSCPALCRASTTSFIVVFKSWMAGPSPAMTASVQDKARKIIEAETAPCPT
jgi:hypothetical protein